MTICDFHGGLARLNDGFDSLKTAWGEAVARWDDPASRRFHKDCLEPVDPIIRRAVSAIQHLAEVVGRAERELSDK